jgi:tetratricopeptide (TPR) repeat protein
MYTSFSNKKQHKVKMKHLDQLTEGLKEARKEYNNANYQQSANILETLQQKLNITNNASFSLNLAKAYARLNDKKAFTYFEDAIDIEQSKNNADSDFLQEIYLESANFYFNVNKLPQAKKYYEKIKDLVGENLFKYALVLYQKEGPIKFKELLNSIFYLSPFKSHLFLSLIVKVPYLPRVYCFFKAKF